ncbi:MAG: threonine aldolase family protein, partial [Flavisolibacter sp.]
GARLYNALVAKNEKPEEFGQLFHSISVCFNKGLGCPAGSILLGTEAFIRRAIRVRKVFGGGMRQAGFMAATALYALENNIERLAMDHDHAKKIGDALIRHPSIKTVLPVETNLVIFELADEKKPKEFIAFMKQHNILLLTISDKRLRLVTHLDISSEKVDYFIKVLGQIN